MNILELSYIGILIGIVGIVLVFIISLIAYFHMKKAVKDGKYKEYIQPALSNTDFSIQNAVKYLKIVNAREVEVEHNE